MLAALLHGKVSQQIEEMEDVLTSTVFGLMNYVPLEEGLLPFIWQAKDVAGITDLSRLSKGMQFRIDYWPNLREPNCTPCEPDLLLYFTTEGIEYVLLIEAKFKSGKSSYEDSNDLLATDQLAKEWQNLVSLCQSRSSKHKTVIPILIYLTADNTVPSADINASLSELGSKSKSQTDLNYPITWGWLSWRSIPSLFRDNDNRILNDLAKLMERLQLTYFEGFTELTIHTDIDWKFEDVFNWTLEPIDSQWSFLE